MTIVKPRLIDAYQHIGTPRFQSVETALDILDANGIAKALVCPYESCPDLAEVHRAYALAPDRFRIFGLALGRDAKEVEDGLAAQFTAGFEGMRLTAERVALLPGILDVIGRNKGIAMIGGENGLSAIAGRLVAFLDRHNDSLVVSPHFAGPTEPDLFERDDSVRALFRHPQFYVVMSRQGMFPASCIIPWAAALLREVGYERILWGSEAPVLHWRDESIAASASWFDQFDLTVAQRMQLFAQNAERSIFQRPVRTCAPLRLPYDPRLLGIESPAPLFPFGFNADTRIPSRLLAAWQRSGGAEGEPLSQFVSRLLLEMLEPTENKR
jgi:hypothetical protein